MLKTTLSTITIGMGLLASNAYADVRINGFANFTAGVITDESFDANGQPQTLFGYDSDINFANGSLFALQVSGNVNDKMTATAQIVARGEDDYKAELEWAYLTYNVSDNLAINAGRLRLPLFRYSASSDVGYSFHWIEVPFSVYDVPFTNLDGLRIDYNGYVGDWDYNVQLGAGQYSNEIGGGDITGDNVLLFTAETSYESFKARVVAGRGTTTFSQGAADAAFDQLELISKPLADLMRMENDTGVFLGLGLEYDAFDWFVSTEITEVSTDESFSAVDSAYYVTVGARIGKFTPSLTHEARDGSGDIKFLDGVAALPPELQPIAGAVVVGFQEFFFEDYEVTTLSMRYDLDTQIALKADISKFDDKISDARDTNLIRLSVNYVF